MRTTLYNYFHGRLWLKADRQGKISTHEAKTLLGMRHNIPKPLRYNILRDMSERGLLKWENGKTIKLLRKPKTIIGNALEGYEIRLF